MVKVNNKLWKINFEQLTINSSWSSDSIFHWLTLVYSKENSHKIPIN